MHKIFYSIFVCFLTINICHAAATPKATLERIKPIGKVVVESTDTESKNDTAKPTAIPSAQSTAVVKTPIEIYQKHCFVCHDSGAGGAPKLSDKAQWQERNKQGLKTLVKHSITGYKLMPPKGTCVDCTDQQMEAVVKYMLGKALQN